MTVAGAETHPVTVERILPVVAVVEPETVEMVEMVETV